mmetsp:Transcript_25477/g.39269  ORF Transcript_25477/g.39269 Transcript_25477/m.39269 type:complete len:102 (-) Transcript_25477:72-377(-)
MQDVFSLIENVKTDQAATALNDNVSTRSPGFNSAQNTSDETRALPSDNLTGDRPGGSMMSEIPFDNQSVTSSVNNTSVKARRRLEIKKLEQEYAKLSRRFD